MIAILWRITRGYRLRPWRSPYLRWRLETYWGIPAERIAFAEFRDLATVHARDFWRYLAWAARMDRAQKRGQTHLPLAGKCVCPLFALLALLAYF